MKLVPTFRSTLRAFAADLPLLQAFITKLTIAANKARQEDTASLKSKILEYILPDPNSDTLKPALSGSHSKSSYGFNHQVTAYYLCLVNWMETYVDHLDQLMEDVNNRKLCVYASHWPTFMYNFVEDYDPDNTDFGLCRGLILVCVFQHIFTGPSSVLRTPSQGTKNPKATIYGLTAVTGRTIMYAAVQAQFALCLTEKWEHMDDHFDHEVFFRNIVKLFEDDPEDNRVVDTLKWWNKQVPGLAPHHHKQQSYAQQEDFDLGNEDAANRALLQQRAQGQNAEPQPPP